LPAPQRRTVVRARETERLELPPGYDTPRFRERLLRATAGLPFEVFRIDRGGLSVRGAVGLLEVGDLQLELRPKVDLTEEEAP
jgi:hypothetical protein